MMMLSFALLFPSLVLANGVSVSAREELGHPSLRNLNGHGNKHGNTGKNVMTQPCLLVNRIMDGNSHENTESHWDCQLDKEDRSRQGSKLGIVRFEGADIKTKYGKGQKLVSGETTFFAPGIELNSHAKAKVPDHANAVFSRREKSEKEEKNSRRLAATGSKSTLVLRVIAQDSQASSTAQELSDEIFGTNGDLVNMRSQYGDCSNDQIDFVPVTSNTSVADGVHEVSIAMNVLDLHEMVVVNAVLEQAELDLGLADDAFSFDTDPPVYDHVMICLPEGVSIQAGNVLAYGYVNKFLTVFADPYCTKPALTMHEVGHNLGLQHSNEDIFYDDITGVMGLDTGGLSYMEDDLQQCFNPAKTWQLGWYSDYHKTFDQATETSWRGDLVGSAEFNALDTVLVKIPNGGDSAAYYMAFNRATGNNADTGEGIDQVIVVSKSGTDDEAVDSYLVAKLSAGESYTMSINGQDDVTVTVHTIDTTSVPGKADIELEVTQCAPGESIVTVTITFDDYPSETSWNLVNTCTNEVIASGFGYTEAGATESQDVCVSGSPTMKFVIKDEQKDGICCSYGNGAYSVAMDGTEVASGGTFGRRQIRDLPGGSCPV